MERTLSQHLREPEWSCKMIDRIMNKACEMKDKELTLDTDKVRRINRELRDWGRKEAKEVDRLRDLLDEIVMLALSSEDANDFIRWVIEKYPKP